MKIGVIRAMSALGLMAATINCYAFPNNSGQIGPRTAYVDDVELCDNGTLLIRLTFTPLAIPENWGYWDMPATWFYVNPNDNSSDNYQRLVTTSATAEANQFVVNYFVANSTSATFTCNNVTADAVGELQVLDILNHG